MEIRYIPSYLLIALYVVVLASGGALAQSPQEILKVPVVVAEAVERELAPTAWFAGTVISRNDARLSAELEGRLLWVAEVGDIVKEGDPVARLDDILIRQSFVENEAQVAREQARLDYLAKEVKRLQKLVKEKNAAVSNYDQAISDQAVTRSELAAARARVRMAQERLDRTEIRAPFNGVVTERFAQAGEWAESGNPIVRLVDSQALEVQTRVPSRALAHVHVGSDLKLTASPEEAQGKVRAIVPVGDDLSRLYELRLTIEDDAPWSAGKILRVAVPTAAARPVVTVPRDALVLRRDGIVVFKIAKDGTVERVPVATGIAAGPYIEIRGDVHPGDQVVIRGGERLRPGQPVQIVPKQET